MRINGSLRFNLWLLVAGLVAMAGSTASVADAAVVTKLKAQLIWGTDGEKPSENTCKELNEPLKKKLCRVFKWKNYFEISQQSVVLAGETKRLKMSAKCEVEVRSLDDSTLEIKLFGEGKWTKTVRQSLKALNKGEIAVIAGDAKDNINDAWFVVFSVPHD